MKQITQFLLEGESSTFSLGTSYSLLCILGKKYNFPRLVGFLKPYEKHMHCSGEIHFIERSLLSTVLLSSISFTSSLLSPNLTTS